MSIGRILTVQRRVELRYLATFLSRVFLLRADVNATIKVSMFSVF